jgi:uncharacterized protein (DUF2235 family)
LADWLSANVKSIAIWCGALSTFAIYSVLYAENRFYRLFEHIFIGLATGYGLDDNVLNSYEFIVDNYEEGDAIYLFGFSRGAYTVRVLAGLIHKAGLISKQQTNLAGSGLTAYKQFSSDTPDGGLDLRQFTDAGMMDPGPASRYDQAAQYARILSVRWPTIKFVGVWDTVASVIVPRPDRLYWPSLQVLAFVHRNRAWRSSARRCRSTRSAGCSGCSRGKTPSSCRTASRRPTTKGRRIPCRSGSPACMPISAAAIRKFRGPVSTRCCG